MARWFAEHGVAALTYDKRGVGASTGDFRTVAFTDLAADGLAAVAVLKARPDVDSKRIGVWGLSQGGWLGPLAASQSKDIAFVIAVSGPGVSPGEQMIFYYGNLLRERGFSDGEVTEAGEMRRQLWHLFSTGDGYDAAGRALDHARSRPWFAAVNEQSDGMLSRPTKALLNDPALRSRQWVPVRGELRPENRPARALGAGPLHLRRQGRAGAGRAERRDHPSDAEGRRTSRVLDRGLPGRGPRHVRDGRERGRTLAPGYLDAIEGWLRTTLSH